MHGNTCMRVRLCAHLCVCLSSHSFAYRGGEGSSVPHSKVLMQTRRRAQVSSSVCIIIRFYPTNMWLQDTFLLCTWNLPCCVTLRAASLLSTWIWLPFPVMMHLFISLGIALQTKLAFTHTYMYTNMHVTGGNERLTVCHVPLMEVHERLWNK